MLQTHHFQVLNQNYAPPNETPCIFLDCEFGLIIVGLKNTEPLISET